MPRMTLITRVNCHLCDDARAVLARVQQATGERWAELDVDSSDELAGEYSDRVPVLLLDGSEHGFWRLDEPRLLRELQAR